MVVITNFGYYCSKYEKYRIGLLSSGNCTVHTVVSFGVLQDYNIPFIHFKSNNQIGDLRNTVAYAQATWKKTLQLVAFDPTKQITYSNKSSTQYSSPSAKSESFRNSTTTKTHQNPEDIGNSGKVWNVT